MQEINFHNRGQGLVGVIIVPVIIGLIITSSLYLYFSRQIPEIPKISEKPTEEIIKPEEEIATILPEEELSKEVTIPKEKIEEKPIVLPKEIVSVPKIEEPLIQKCADGTLYDQCSTNKPKYCENGNLIDNNVKCGSLSSSKSCSTITTESDVGIIDVTTCELQTRGEVNVGIIEFAPKNVVYRSTLYANFKSLFGCPTSGKRWFNGTTFISNNCYDVINSYSFLDLFHNPARGVSQYVDRKTYNITQKGDETLHSVYYIKDWWEKEAVKYGVTSFSMNIDVKGPYTLLVDPPTSGRWGSEGACSYDLKQFFINEGKKNGIEDSNYDIIVYVYLSDWQLSNRAYQGFTSCVDRSNQKVFASVPTFVYPFEGDTIVMLIHEVGHALGSSDYYTSPCHANSQYQACAKDPEGIPEPNKIPKYPQTKACIMAQLIQSSEPSLESPDVLSTPDLAVLCDAAAKEIGWK